MEPTPPLSGRGPDLEGQEPGPLLTADDAAWMVRVPSSLVYTLARLGEPGIGIGKRHVRFRADALDRWIKSKETSEHNRPRRRRRDTIARTGGSSPPADRGASGTSPRRRAKAPEPGIRSVVSDAG